MLDIKILRENPDRVRRGIINRGGRYLPVLEEALSLDSVYRAALKEVEALRGKRNEAAKKIGALRASGTGDAALLKEAEALKELLRQKEKELSDLEPKMKALAVSLPNIPDESVVIGQTARENKTVRVWGEPKTLGFKPKDHQEIGEGLGLLDFERARKLSGSRFALLCGRGAKLERALITLMLDIHVKENGYKEFWPPYLVTDETLVASGHLPKSREDMYRISRNDTGPEQFLIPTAEAPLVNLHRDEILEEAVFPLAYVAFTSCFRSEAGSYGKDIRGLIRNHQFNKVELVRFSLAEQSMGELEVLTRQACMVLERLNLPYRVIELCTGDMGFASAKTFDLEVWMPSENSWREISSCSNCGDFQARRAGIRVKRVNGKKDFVHTLNGSGVAVGRTFAAILENY
ncbi:MAG: serine--tRNA ligase, partial [Elusimicrobia bacterium]|nr:serine--tRNA ligase [Elusimicrobiota bacterium]